MPNVRIWRAFRITRICVYVIAILLTIALAAIYAVLLIRGWASFIAGQRAIMLALLFLNALSAIVLYLMMLISFRVWLDGARIALLLIFQVGGTVTFSLFYPGFPCSNLGDVSTCKRVEMAAIFGGWSLAGFLLMYAFALSAMCYVPEPSTRRLVLVEDGPMTSQNEKEVYSEKTQKRLSQTSIGSERSLYSQSSFSATQSPTIPRSAYKPGFVSSPTGMAQVQFPPPYYRPDTPGSVHSNTPSSISEIRETTRQRYFQSGLMPAPAPRFPPGLMAPPAPESLSRQTTTSSIRSAMSNRNGQRTPQQQPRNVQFAMPAVNEYYEYPPANVNTLYQFDSNKMVRSPLPDWNRLPSGPQPRPILLSPENSGYSPYPAHVYQRSTPPSSVRGFSSPPHAQPQTVPPAGRVASPFMAAMDNRNVPRPRPTQAPVYTQKLSVGTPSLLPPLQIPIEARQTPSRVPSRAGSSSSVPRSPSPQDTSFPYSLHDRQQFDLLPAHPRLPLRTSSAMGLRRDEGGSGVVPYNPTIIARKLEHKRSLSDSRGMVDHTWAQLNNERNAAIDQWRVVGRYAPPPA
ncbi:hypothetical protein BJ165DRAFT_1523720 [Panaeolus papilionaceus]|nr:hypothetical protein BJ165DRAFT_1523720 [Panaeolus papilionaceus]